MLQEVIEHDKAAQVFPVSKWITFEVLSDRLHIDIETLQQGINSRNVTKVITQRMDWALAPKYGGNSISPLPHIILDHKAFQMLRCSTTDKIA